MMTRMVRVPQIACDDLDVRILPRGYQPAQRILATPCPAGSTGQTARGRQHGAGRPSRGGCYSCGGCDDNVT